MSTEVLLQILKMGAGVGLFLFGMYLQEEALKALAGRSFKVFLQRNTRSNVRAVALGAIVTGILQSSSIVSLMVLAFVGAGIFSLKNAMGIILGANLGSTFYGWLIALVGFKVDIEPVAYPMVFAGGLLIVTMGQRKPVRFASYLLLGFGLLFIGLAFMKTAMEAQSFDFSRYAQMPLLAFLLIGFVITVIVQSSSVTIALTLSALYAGSISFPVAAAIALGSESGTTIKILLGSLGGTVAKKRVALGHLLFNLILTFGAFLLIRPIIFLITDVLGIKDQLIALVSFSSLINLMAIIIFLPFLRAFTDFLQKFFKDTDASAAAFIGHASVNEPQTALALFRAEAGYFIHNSMLFNLSLFGINTTALHSHPDYESANEKRRYSSKTEEEMYDFLKQLQGELQAFYIKLRSQLEGQQSVQLNQLIAAVRNAMYSVKSMKDVGGNINNLKRSSKDIKFDFFMDRKKELEALYVQLNAFREQSDHPRAEILLAMFHQVHQSYESSLSDFYKEAQHHPVEDIDITTTLNFNRELFTSNKAMVMAVKDLFLDESGAQEFNGMLGYGA